MKKLIFAVVTLALASGMAKRGVAADTVTLPDNKDSRFLNQAEISKAIEQLANLEYPATQGEIAAKLDIANRNLPVLGIAGRDVKGPGGSKEYLQYDLTNPDDPHRRYYLYVWIDLGAEKLSGPAFSNGRVVGYAEIALVDHDIDATLVAQSRRYPARDIGYLNRKLRRD